jgi:hypothetical protein
MVILARLVSMGFSEISMVRLDLGGLARSFLRLGYCKHRRVFRELKNIRASGSCESANDAEFNGVGASHE